MLKVVGIKKETDDRVKEKRLLLIKDFQKHISENSLVMVTDHLVVFLMSLYLVLFHHVDLVGLVKYMIITFLN